MAASLSRPSILVSKETSDIVARRHRQECANPFSLVFHDDYVSPPSPLALYRDLKIKHMFTTHPVLWQCLLIIADTPTQPSGLITCAPLVRSLLTVLTQHWQRCCADSTAKFSRELQLSVLLVECIATVTIPLSRICGDPLRTKCSCFFIVNCLPPL